MSDCQIKTGNLATGKVLVSTAQLFDRRYYDSEELGEIITDGLKAMKRMLKRVNNIASSDPYCLRWIDGKQLEQVQLGLEMLTELTKCSSPAGSSEEKVIPSSWVSRSYPLALRSPLAHPPEEIEGEYPIPF